MNHMHSSGSLGRYTHDTRQHDPALIIGISGASGFVYGMHLLELLASTPIQTHVVVSRAALLTMAHETEYKKDDIIDRADYFYRPDDLAARIASGSFRTMGMIIAPCSMKSLAEIANGLSSNLLTRAADVTLKERRKLVLMPRETPLSLTHLRNMTTVSEMGGIMALPVPAFYARPANLTQMVEHTLGRVLDLFELDLGTVARWREPQAPRLQAVPNPFATKEAL